MNLTKAIKKQLSLSILYYLRFWAKLQLKKTKPTIVGVTGTSGKTSACSAIKTVLQNKFLVKKSHKANSESGLPLNILNLYMTNYSLLDWLRVLLLAPLRLVSYWPKHQVYVAEMAIDSPHSPKNMSYLLTILQPTVGVFLNASTVHGENFDELAKNQDLIKRREEIVKLIANEKGKLIQSLPSTGAAVLNIDDKNVYSFKDLTDTSTSILTFGKNVAATVKFVDSHQSLTGSKLTFKSGGEEITAIWPNCLLADHYGYTIAAALSVGLWFKIEPKKAMAALEKNLSLPPGRSSLIKGINQSFIIDSSYNSSLNPLLDQLKMLSQVAKKRRVAILGDMRELGQQAVGDHQQAAHAIAANCDLVCLVGPAMKKYVLPILKKKEVDCSWYKNAMLAAQAVKNQIQPKDVILVKGSQNNIFLESVVEQLMKNPEEASELLCRRGNFWDQKRSAVFKL